MVKVEGLSGPYRRKSLCQRAGSILRDKLRAFAGIVSYRSASCSLILVMPPQPSIGPNFQTAVGSLGAAETTVAASEVASAARMSFHIEAASDLLARPHVTACVV